MADENAKIDSNSRQSLLGVTDDAAQELRRLLVSPATGRLLVTATGVGTGDVVGPGSATDEGIARFSGTSGKLITNSAVFIGNSGNLYGANSIVVGGNTASAILHAIGTTEQLRVAYDSSNYTSFTVGSTGAMVITGAGGTSAQNFQISGMPLIASNIFQTATTNTSANIFVTSGGGAGTATTQATYLFGGASSVNFRVGSRGSTAATPAANVSYGSFVMGTMAVTEAGSGTHGLIAGMVLKAPTITDGAGATTNTATLYIEGAPSGITPTGANLSVWVDAGEVRIDGDIGDTTNRVNKGWFTDIAISNALTVANGGTGAATLTGLVVGNGTSAFTTVTAPSGTIVGTSDTQTLTNKRNTRRLTTTNAPGATPTTNSDNVDVMNFTGLAAAITSMTTNLSGTPVDGDLLEFRFLDDGTARAITWGATFAATTVALPTTTVISTCLRVLFEWRAASSKWECLASV